MSIKPLVYSPQTRTVSKQWKEKKKEDNSNKKQAQKIKEVSSQVSETGKMNKMQRSGDENEDIIPLADYLQGQQEYYIFCSRCLSYFSERNLMKFSYCHHFFCQVCTKQLSIESANNMIQTSCPFGCKNEQNPEPKPKPKPKPQKIEQQKKQPVKPSKIQCGICAQYFNFDQLKSITQCPHSFCPQCIDNYVKQCLKDMKEIICPEGCKGQYHPGFQLENILDKKQLQLYQKAQMIRNNLRMCSKKDCSGILIQHEQLPKDVVECHACYARYCKKCQWPQHQGNCNSAAQNFIQKGLLFARCPGCKRNIQRNKGCDHITCVCRFQFCYLCLGKWSHGHLCDNNSRIFLINHKGNNRRQQEQFIDRRNINQIMQQTNELERRREVVRRREAINREADIRRRQAWQAQIRQFQMRRREQMRQLQIRRQRYFQIRQEQIRQQQQRMRIKREEQQKILEKQRQRGLQIMIEFKKKMKGKWRLDDDELHENLQKKEKNMKLAPLKATNSNVINRKNIMNSEKKIQKRSEQKIKVTSKDRQERALQMRRNRIQEEKKKLYRQQQQKQRRMKKKMDKIVKNDYKMLWETHFVL